MAFATKWKNDEQIYTFSACIRQYCNRVCHQIGFGALYNQEVDKLSNHSYD